MALSIDHLEKENRFVSIIEDQECFISYSIDKDSNTMSIEHTLVPKPLSGQGIAGELTKHVLAYAKEHQLKVNPVCPYTAAYIKKHPEAL